MSFAYVLLALELLATKQAPSGAQLHVRLTTPVGSYASRSGDAVNAVLIAPVFSRGEMILPSGTMVSGKLKAVQRVGLGFVHEMAALELEFNTLTLPGGEVLPLTARVQEVDNARETLSRDGRIRGTRTTSSLSYRAGGYIRTALLWDLHAEVAVWAIKTLLVQVPEAELYYPAGVELTLVSTEPINVHAANSSSEVTSLSDSESARLAALVDMLPARTRAYSSRPSDLINVMFIGDRDDLVSAFEGAGWVQPTSTTLRSNIRRIRAVADGRGDSTAPMSDLLLHDVKADLSWQKSFNDVAKRHHIRIWKQPITWNGREVWIGAATHDIDFTFWRPGTPMTHRIAVDVDQEREKVVNDLVFTTCAARLPEAERLDVPTFTRNATGDPMRTDGRIAIVDINPCMTPGGAVTPTTAALPLHGSKMQRFIRREVLSLRSDVLRENIYWRGYEGLRMMITAFHQRRARTEENSDRPMADQAMKQTSNRSAFITDMFR